MRESRTRKARAPEARGRNGRRKSLERRSAGRAKRRPKQRVGKRSIRRSKRRLPRHHAIAFREAGHAVAAWKRGVMLMPISIFASSKSAGRNVWNDPLRNVDLEWVRTARSPALARRLAAILVAGPVAEKLFGPKLPRTTISLERLRHARTLLEAASRSSPGSPRMLFDEALAEAKAFLEEPRVARAVAALAAVLLRRGTVRGGSAASLIEMQLGV